MQHAIQLSGAPTTFAGVLPAAGPVRGWSPDVARRAAECALVERRLGSRDPVQTLYRRAYSLLRTLRGHLARLDDRTASRNRSAA